MHGEPAEIEFVFEPQEEGGYHIYAPDLSGLHTQGDTLEDATANAEEALALVLAWDLRAAGVRRRSVRVPIVAALFAGLTTMEEMVVERAPLRRHIDAADCGAAALPATPQVLLFAAGSCTTRTVQ